MTTGWALTLVALAVLVAIVAMAVAMGHLDRRIDALEDVSRETPGAGGAGGAGGASV